jgi:hypothetical protein|tara:strand:- start:2692 stop:3243 length:552 start_codon:yes stop_codon:yes gene_type:complete
MIKKQNTILEDKKSNYSYGCVMLFFKFPKLVNIHNIIQPQHIYTELLDISYGLETEAHTSLLYGLHDTVSLNDVTGVLQKYNYGEYKLTNPSLFENEKFDVLKFEVSGDNLYKTNTDLKQFPYTSSYPDYQPHLTVAYLKSGMGKYYVDIINKANVTEFSLIPTHAVFSEADGTKSKIKININ